MVDVSSKQESARTAAAAGFVRMNDAALDAVEAGRGRKGDAAAVAELAGVMGAKKTPEIIPLCHPLALSGIAIETRVDREAGGVHVTAQVKTTGRTGVEMEALTAVACACLTLYDMLKSVDRSMEITGVTLIEKTGGASGDYRRKDG